jgi:hypothetical protein
LTVWAGSQRAGSSEVGSSGYGGTITPELALVSPEFAEFARAVMPDPGEVHWGTFGFSVVRGDATAVRRREARVTRQSDAVAAPAADEQAPVRSRALVERHWSRARSIVVLASVATALVLYPELDFTGARVRPELSSSPTGAGSSQGGAVKKMSTTAEKQMSTTAEAARPDRGLQPSGESGPVRLRWRPQPDATYYNIQVFRRGRKVFEAWPVTPYVTLASHWTYRGRNYRLTAARYEWFVWPGLGPREAARYGELLHREGFSIATRPA